MTFVPPRPLAEREPMSGQSGTALRSDSLRAVSVRQAAIFRY